MISSLARVSQFSAQFVCRGFVERNGLFECRHLEISEFANFFLHFQNGFSGFDVKANVLSLRSWFVVETAPATFQSDAEVSYIIDHSGYNAKLGKKIGERLVPHRHTDFVFLQRMES